MTHFLKTCHKADDKKHKGQRTGLLPRNVRHLQPPSRSNASDHQTQWNTIDCQNRYRTVLDHYINRVSVYYHFLLGLTFGQKNHKRHACICKSIEFTRTQRTLAVKRKWRWQWWRWQPSCRQSGQHTCIKLCQVFIYRLNAFNIHFLKRPWWYRQRPGFIWLRVWVSEEVGPWRSVIKVMTDLISVATSAADSDRCPMISKNAAGNRRTDRRMEGWTNRGTDRQTIYYVV